MKRSGAQSLVSAILAMLAWSGCSRRAAPPPAVPVASGGGGTTSPYLTEGSFVSYPASDYYEREPGHPGGTLRMSATTDIGTLDLQISSSTNGKWLGRIIYDNLTYLDNEGNIGPWIAESWTISPDGKTYVFHIRRGVTFSDGTPLDAEAVRVNLDRMRDPNTRASMSTAYIAPYVDGKVLDPYTFQANLSEPYTAFLNVLAQSWLGLESPKALREHPKTLSTDAVGSGPFVVEHYTRQEGITFVKRKDYDWSPPFVRHHGPAYLDRIELTFVAEDLMRYALLSEGKGDLTMDAPPQNAALIRRNPELAIANRINLGNPTHITLNTTKPPFDDVRIRRAVALAIDREGLARIIGFGEYLPKSDYLSATTRYYDPSFRDALRYNPRESNRLLDELGWTVRDAEGYRTKGGVRLAAKLTSQGAATSAPVLVAIQSDLKKVGFDLAIEQVPSSQLAQRRRNRNYQISGPGVWHTNTPDGLFIRYDSKQISTETFTGQNQSLIQDPELDDVLDRARHATDPAILKPLYRRAQQRLTELVPAVPLYENHTLFAYRRSVHDIVFDTSHNTPFFTCLWIDPQT